MHLLYLSGVSSLQLNEEVCTGCRLCTFVCPRGVFEMGGRKVRIVERDACIECGACALNCTSGALSVISGVGCATGILNGMLGRKSACCTVDDTESTCISC